jgi:hypothetical protein
MEPAEWSQIGEGWRQRMGRESRSRMLTGVAVIGTAAARFQVHSRPLLSPSLLPFPLPLSTGAQLPPFYLSPAHSSLPLPPHAALSFPLTRASCSPLPHTFSISWHSSTPIGDDFGRKATPYARMPRRARRRDTKLARTTRRRLGDALITFAVI